MRGFEKTALNSSAVFLIFVPHRDLLQGTEGEFTSNTNVASGSFATDLAPAGV